MGQGARFLGIQNAVVYSFFLSSPTTHLQTTYPHEPAIVIGSSNSTHDSTLFCKRGESSLSRFVVRHAYVCLTSQHLNATLMSYSTASKDSKIEEGNVYQHVSWHAYLGELGNIFRMTNDHDLPHLLECGLHELRTCHTVRHLDVCVCT